MVQSVWRVCVSLSVCYHSSFLRDVSLYHCSYLRHSLGYGDTLKPARFVVFVLLLVCFDF